MDGLSSLESKSFRQGKGFKTEALVMHPMQPVV